MAQNETYDVTVTVRAVVTGPGVTLVQAAAEVAAVVGQAVGDRAREPEDGHPVVKYPVVSEVHAVRRGLS